MRGFELIEYQVVYLTLTYIIPYAGINYMDGYFAFFGTSERRINRQDGLTGSVFIVRDGPHPRSLTDREGAQAVEAVVASCQESIVGSPFFSHDLATYAKNDSALIVARTLLTYIIPYAGINYVDGYFAFFGTSERRINRQDGLAGRVFIVRDGPHPRSLTDREGAQAVEAVVASCQQAIVRCPVFSHVLTLYAKIECEQIVGGIQRTTVVVAEDIGDDGV